MIGRLGRFNKGKNKNYSKFHSIIQRELLLSVVLITLLPGWLALLVYLSICTWKYPEKHYIELKRKVSVL